jgi:hypothetical protein
MSAPLVHLLLLLLSASVARAALPAWEALERAGLEQVLAVDGHGALWLVPESRLDSADCQARLLAGGSGGGGLSRMAEADARLGLHWLALDSGGKSLLQLDRQGLPLGRTGLEEHPGLSRPEFLALSASRSLVLADPREGSVAVRRPGESWNTLLDYAGAGALSPRVLEVVGERVFLLDGREGGRLWLCGTEGGWRQSMPAADVVCLHRGEGGSLLLLRRREGRLELEQWPDAASLAGLPDPRRRTLAAYADPGGLPRDFLTLAAPLDSAAPRLLLTRSGLPAVVLLPGEEIR